jgi:hypothetical protein
LFLVLHMAFQKEYCIRERERKRRQRALLKSLGGGKGTGSALATALFLAGATSGGDEPNGGDHDDDSSLDTATVPQVGQC